MAKLSPAVTALTAFHWHQHLAPHLVDGEMVIAFASAHHLKPTTEGVAFTTARVLGFNTAACPHEVITLSVCADEIASYDLTSVHLTPTLTIHTPAGTVEFGAFAKEEMDFIAYFLDTLRDAGIDPAVAPAIDLLRESGEHRTESERLAERARVVVFGEPMTESQWAAVEECNGFGRLQLVVNSGRAGQLAVYDDRIVVVKRDRGAEHTTLIGNYPLSEVTDLHYRCGALTGQLEVLTAGYPGAGTDNFWPDALTTGSDRSWTQPHVLRLPKPYYQQAREQLERIRQQLAEAHTAAHVAF